MNHILRRIIDRMIINRRIDHPTETSQLTDPIHNHSHMLTIDPNSKIIFRRVLLVARRKMTTTTRILETVTIRERINGLVSLTQPIRDKIVFRMRMLCHTIRPAIHERRIHTIRKIHIKVLLRLIHRTVQNIRKISTKRSVY